MRSASAVWLREAMTAGITLWVFVSAGLAWVDRANHPSIPGAWFFLFVIGLGPIAGAAGLCGVLGAALDRRLQSGPHRRRHILLLRLLTPLVIGAVSGLVVLLAAVSARAGVRWWPGVGVVAIAMGIPAMFAAWWRTPAIVRRSRPGMIAGTESGNPAGRPGPTGNP